jgi:hypothetical protein
MERIIILIFYGLLLPGLGFDHHSKPVKKFGAFFVGCLWLYICILLELLISSTA